jgi:DNA-directed RNA polymerase specialized sigma24 family protein
LRRRRRDEQERAAAVKLLAARPNVEPDPSDVVALAEETHLALQRYAATSSARTALVLLSEGYTYNEIATILEISERAVEGMLYRIRKRATRADRTGPLDS